MVTQSPAFNQAIEDSRKLKAKPTNDELLEVGYPCCSSCGSCLEANLYSSCSCMLSSRQEMGRTLPKQRSQAPLISKYVELANLSRLRALVTQPTLEFL